MRGGLCYQAFGHNIARQHPQSRGCRPSIKLGCLRVTTRVPDIRLPILAVSPHRVHTMRVVEYQTGKQDSVGCIFRFI